MQDERSYYVPTPEEEIQAIKAILGGLERSNADIIAKYGHGVRPSWVSADLAMNSDRIQYYRQKLAKLEGQTDA